MVVDGPARRLQTGGWCARPHSPHETNRRRTQCEGLNSYDSPSPKTSTYTANLPFRRFQQDEHTVRRVTFVIFCRHYIVNGSSHAGALQTRIVPTCVLFPVRGIVNLPIPPSGSGALKGDQREEAWY